MRLIPFCILLLIAACGTPTSIQPTQFSNAKIAKMQAYVAGETRNPSTAQFRKIRTYSVANGDDVLCGELNGQNGFGGFTGYEPFYARFRGGLIKVLELDASLGRIACDQAASGTINIGS